MVLKKIRTSRGLTQKELAEISKISIRTIQNYECGHRDINKAPITHLIALSNALDIKFYELLTSGIAYEIKKNLKE